MTRTTLPAGVSVLGLRHNDEVSGSPSFVEVALVPARAWCRKFKNKARYSDRVWMGKVADLYATPTQLAKLSLLWAKWHDLMKSLALQPAQDHLQRRDQCDWKSSM